MESESEVTKDSIRRHVWSFLEDSNLALFPRPVFQRIPNFKGSDIACNKVKELEEFQTAKVVKVSPDKPQQQIRYLTLEANKELLVPSPRIKKSLLNKIVPPNNPSKSILRRCSSSEGVKYFSRKIGLRDKINIDLIVIGSVAVTTAGYRIGKGEGYADLEYAMLLTLGFVSSSTPIVTVVHDCQVIDTIPTELFGLHDVPVDIIVTPTRIIRCNSNLPRPQAIIWSILSKEKIKEIPTLMLIKRALEKKVLQILF